MENIRIWLRKFGLYLVVMVVFLPVGSNAAVSTPRLDIGTIAGSPGLTVILPITLSSSSGANISALGMDIGYDASKLENPTASIGVAGTQSGKSVIMNSPKSGIFRIGAIDLYHTSIIPDGIVIYVSFSVKSGVSPGQIVLTNVPSASDPTGNPVTITGSNGSITLATGQYTLTTNISGKGSINNMSPTPVFTCAYPNTSCSSLYSVGASFVLHAMPSENYSFGNWTGCDSVDVSGNCVVSLINNIVVGANFTQLPLVKVSGNTTAFFTLQDAFDHATDGSVISARNVVFSDNSLNLSNNKSTTFNGGLGSDFTVVNGYSYLPGVLKIINGSLRINNLVVR